jgi:hypothetical protein
VVIQTLCPSVPVNATTGADWPVVVEVNVPFHTPGVVAAVGVAGLGGAPVGVGEGVVPVFPPPPPQAVTDRAAVVSAKTTMHRRMVTFIGFSRIGVGFEVRRSGVSAGGAAVAGTTALRLAEPT